MSESRRPLAAEGAHRPSWRRRTCRRAAGQPRAPAKRERSGDDIIHSYRSPARTISKRLKTRSQRVLDIAPLDPASTALVLVDIQRKMVDDSGAAMFRGRSGGKAGWDGDVRSARWQRIQDV